MVLKGVFRNLHTLFYTVTESIFPKAFDDAALESYTESQDTYTSLFEDRNKYNAIMGALAEVIYREMRK